MRHIRNGVFETNSSSSHSIAIRKIGGYYSNAEVLRCTYRVWDGKLRLYESDLEFGRAPFKPCTDFFSKWCFAMASLGSDDTCREELESVIREYFPDLIIEYPRCYWGSREGEPFYGSIDHQSMGVLSSCLARNKISIREFLLNKKYVAFIDGDEYQVTETLFDSGLLRVEDFEDPGIDVEDLDSVRYANEN